MTTRKLLLAGMISGVISKWLMGINISKINSHVVEFSEEDEHFRKSCYGKFYKVIPCKC
jgi:hypothetical protein